MTSGSAIKKIKSERKDLIKENDIKSSIKSGKKYQYPTLFLLLNKAPQSVQQLPQYVMKRHFTSSRHGQNPSVYVSERQRLS